MTPSAPSLANQVQMMSALDRRRMLLTAALALCPPIGAIGAPRLERLTITGPTHPIDVIRVPAPGEAPRPSVLVLHGSSGFAPYFEAYRRYGDALAGVGVDAWLVSYYGPADRIEERSGNMALIRSMDTRHRDAWVATVSSVTDAVLARPEAGGRVGLLGFSRGAFLAVTAAARDERITALAVLYGAILAATRPELKRLPPLLALHGSADHDVTPQRGRDLVETAKRLGGSAEMVIYPGLGHAFDLEPDRPQAIDARRRVAAFFKARLSP